jgi:hypothetical protein
MSRAHPARPPACTRPPARTLHHAPPHATVRAPALALATARAAAGAFAAASPLTIDLSFPSPLRRLWARCFPTPLTCASRRLCPLIVVLPSPLLGGLPKTSHATRMWITSKMARFDCSRAAPVWPNGPTCCPPPHGILPFALVRERRLHRGWPFLNPAHLKLTARGGRLRPSHAHTGGWRADCKVRQHLFHELTGGCLC